MIHIDQDVLCNFCETAYDTNRDNCEGSHCKDAKDSYLEEKGIEDGESKEKSFNNISIGDAIFVLIQEKVILPELRQYKIDAISKREDGDLSIQSKREFSTTRTDKVPVKTINMAIYKDCYLNLSDCQKAMEELCTKKIVQLAKLIGRLNS